MPPSTHFAEPVPGPMLYRLPTPGSTLPGAPIVPAQKRPSGEHLPSFQRMSGVVSGWHRCVTAPLAKSSVARPVPSATSAPAPPASGTTVPQYAGMGYARGGGAPGYGDWTNTAGPAHRFDGP